MPWSNRSWKADVPLAGLCSHMPHRLRASLLTYQWFPGPPKEILTISNFHLMCRLQNLTSRWSAISLDKNITGSLRNWGQQVVAWEAVSESTKRTEQSRCTARNTDEKKKRMFLIILLPGSAPFTETASQGDSRIFPITTTPPSPLGLSASYLQHQDS